MEVSRRARKVIREMAARRRKSFGPLIFSSSGASLLDSVGVGGVRS
jgi:hypothetical protein